MQNLRDIVNANLCLGCGLCSFNKITDSPVKMNFSSKRGHVIPQIDDLNSLNAQIGFKICPGKGYFVESLAKEYNLGEHYNKDIGLFNSIRVVTTLDDKVLLNASSSGIMTTILNFLIENNHVDKAIVTKFVYSNEGPVARPFITSQYNDLLDAQGSKYCPVDFSDLLNELKTNQGKSTYAFVGTPCQIASLRSIQNNACDLGIKFFIGNFCGGFKSYNNLKRLIKMNNIKPYDVEYFRFRGGGQPGSMKIQTNSKVIEIPYPEYVKTTGYTKVKRCHFCVDATAELADFSCGDAWLPEYINTNCPTSIVIARTKEATEIIEQIAKSNLITSLPLSEEKVIESQFDNIFTKKYRQRGRIELYRFLGIGVPEMVEGFELNAKYSFLLELRIFISHKIKLIFEKVGLFYFFYYKNSFFKRIFRTIFSDIYN